MSTELRSLVVTITDDKLANIDQVAERLAAEGFQVDQVFPMTGVIVGASAPAQMAALARVDGVMSVEEEAITHLS